MFRALGETHIIIINTQSIGYLTRVCYQSCMNKTTMEHRLDWGNDTLYGSPLLICVF